MHTNILVLPHKHPNTVRWLIAVLLAWSLALALMISPAHAAGSCATPNQSFDLWAKSGTLTLPDSSTVTIWGYAANSGDAAQVPGPTLTATEGDCVQVTLHNSLAEDSSLALHGQGLGTDTAGAIAGGTKVYTFSAAQGTFLYEAGLTTNGARQVAMGLYGALIVQPASAPDAYSSETVLVLSEIDPDLNAAPTTFNLGEFKPRYWFINGQAYPSIPDLSLVGGSTARVRYINAGLNENSMGLLGLDQQVFAVDGYALPNPYSVVAETIPPGGTLDTLVSIPTATGVRYPLYSAAQHLNNNGAAYGGQLMYLSVPAVDQPPTVNAGTDQTVTLPASAALDGTVTDDSLSALTTAWSMTSGPGTVTFGDPSQVDTTASFSTSGAYVLRLTATDGTGPVFDEVSLTVDPAPPVNQAPVVSAGSDQSITLPNSATLAGTATDDGLPNPPATLTTTWSLVSGPGTATFADAAALNTTASFSIDGIYVLRLTGEDGELTATSDVTITVAPQPVAPQPAIVPVPVDIQPKDQPDTTPIDLPATQ